MTRILGIETSCDETAAAIVEDRTRVRSNVVASSAEVHRRYGGVVPEVASRQHLLAIGPTIQEAMERAGVSFRDLDAIAVTHGPGLAGSLLVGVAAAKSLAWSHGLPLVGIHHMEGHIFSAVLGDDRLPAREMVPHVALLVSGGHSELVAVEGLGRYRILGSTRDDAAGEAFDKAAKLLGLGYPGGPVVDGLAGEGNPRAIDFPRGMIDRDDYDFSFSGLKTALLVHLETRGQPDSHATGAPLAAN